MHDSSPRVARFFVVVNCSAISDSLFESELFGHIKGSFTDANTFRRGLLEEPSGWSFFLDEVGDLSPAAQAKLLRLLQEGEIRRMGSNESTPVDLRIIAASRRNLQYLVNSDHFREDLLYRLNTVTISLPPIRERPEDIPLLAEFFLSRYTAESETRVTSFSPGAIQATHKYSWPENVRELEHVIERAVALASHSILSTDDLPQAVRDRSLHGGNSSQELLGTSRTLQHEHVLSLLDSIGWNKERTSCLLGISPRTLYRLLDRYGLAKISSAHLEEGSDSSRS